MAPIFFLADLWTGPAPRAGPVEKKVSRKKFRPPPATLRAFLVPKCKEIFNTPKRGEKKNARKVGPFFNLTRARLDPPFGLTRILKILSTRKVYIYANSYTKVRFEM